MKITYWLIECERDSSAYDIRERTKRAALERYQTGVYSRSDYATEIQRITVSYTDGFDLLDNVLSEGGYHCLIIDRKTYPITQNEA